ncbi:MAG TPA: PIN domain-containing protein [Armatimonadota bacterium]|nr:PIN domain-containing protein [Armatimonadota bacterium]
MNYALDASALVAYLNGEPGASVVAGLLPDPNNLCYAHAINLCEVFYGTLRAANERAARAAITTLYTDGVIMRRDMSERFWKRVGRLKATGKISIPDCFRIVLAQRVGGEVVTSEHREFNPLGPLAIAPILFIR